MNEKLLRSFFGAAICVIIAIWPAATWNEPILLLPSGILGWLLGYHTNHVWRGFILGWQNTKIWLYGKKLTWFHWNFSLQRFLPNLIEKMMINISNFFSATPQLLKHAVQAVRNGYIEIVTLFAHLSKTINNWYNCHPINKACIVRTIVSLSFLGLMALGMWELMVVYGPQVSDMVKTNTKGELYPGVLFIVYVQRGVAIVTAFTILHMPAVAFYSTECNTMRGFYTIWERHDAMSKPLFIANEIFHLLWIQLWWAFMLLGVVIVTFGGFIFAGTVGGITMAFVVGGLKFMWYIVRLNKNYGLVSLAVGLLVGIITFYTQRVELVANPVYRLTVSFFTSVTSGTISFGLTWLGEKLFKRRKWSYKIVTTKNAIFNVMTILLKKVKKGIFMFWRNGKRALPANVSTSLL